MRCDTCGRFAHHLNDVWANPPQNGIDREVCDDCYGVTVTIGSVTLNDLPRETTCEVIA